MLPAAGSFPSPTRPVPGASATSTDFPKVALLAVPMIGPPIALAPWRVNCYAEEVYSLPRPENVVRGPPRAPPPDNARARPKRLHGLVSLAPRSPRVAVRRHRRADAGALQ